MGLGSTFEPQTTDESGWFVFRGLWPGDRYKVVIEAPGGGKAEPPEIEGQGRRDPGPRHDRAGRRRRPHRRPGRRLRRPARSPARPSSTAATAPDAAHRPHRRHGPVPARRPVPRDQVRVRPQGGLSLHRREGRGRRRRPDHHAAPDRRAAPRLEARRGPDARGPARLRPQGAGPHLGDASARRPSQNGASACIPAMARIDLDLALQWSAERGHRFDGRGPPGGGRGAGRDRRPRRARAAGPGRRRSASSTPSSELAERFAETDPKKALLFAEEAAVQARSLPAARPDLRPGPGRRGARPARPRRGRAQGSSTRPPRTPPAWASRAWRAMPAAVAARALAPSTSTAPWPWSRRSPTRTTRSRYTGFVAGAIAATNTDRAVAMADAISQESTLPDNDPDRDRLPDRPPSIPTGRSGSSRG